MCAANPIKQLTTRAWYKALKRANIENFRWHDPRHTWALWHAQNEMPMNVLQELGGWESAEMVRRYAHLGSAHLAKYSENSSRSSTSTSQLRHKAQNKKGLARAKPLKNMVGRERFERSTN